MFFKKKYKSLLLQLEKDVDDIKYQKGILESKVSMLYKKHRDTVINKKFKTIVNGKQITFTCIDTIFRSGELYLCSGNKISIGLGFEKYEIEVPENSCVKL